MRISPSPRLVGKLAVALAVTAALLAGLATADAHPRPPRDELLAGAFTRVDQHTTWTLSARIDPTSWIPAGAHWEPEGFKTVDGRFYISMFDKDHDEGRLEIVAGNGRLIRDVPLPDGVRDHAGGIDVADGAVYVPVAEDHAFSSADVFRVDTRTFAVRKLFTVAHDHVGGVTYDPVRHVLIGQDWDSRTFYEWTLHGRTLATWRNPSDYLGYQDCQYVRSEMLLCSGSPLGIQRLAGFDLIDLADPHHALLNGVPLPVERAGNANELTARPVPGGVRITDYDASHGPILAYTATVPRR